MEKAALEKTKRDEAERKRKEDEVAKMRQMKQDELKKQEERRF